MCFLQFFSFIYSIFLFALFYSGLFVYWPVWFLKRERRGVGRVGEEKIWEEEKKQWSEYTVEEQISIFNKNIFNKNEVCLKIAPK